MAGDLAAAKAAHAKALTPNDELIPAGGGCVGEAAALLLRSQERSVLERGMMWVIETIRASRQGGGGGKGVKEVITSTCENGFPRAGATDSGHAVRVGGVPATTRA